MPRLTLLSFCWLLLFVVACGTDNADNDVPSASTPFVTATPLPEPTARPTLVAASDVVLSGSYARLDGAIAVRHPADWQVDSIGTAERGTLRIGNSRGAQLGRVQAAGDVSVTLDWAPVTDFGLEEATAEFDVALVLQNALADEGLVAGTDYDPAAIQSGTTPDGRAVATLALPERHPAQGYALLNLGGGVAGFMVAQYDGDFGPLVADLLAAVRYGGPVYVAGSQVLPLAPLHVLPHTEFQRINGARFLANDTRLLTWSADGGVRIYDVASGDLLLFVDLGARIVRVAVSADERIALVLPEAQPILRYDISPALESTPAETLSPGGATRYLAPIGRIQDFRWSPDEQTVAGIVVNNQNYSVMVWDIGSAELLDTYRLTVGSRIDGILWNNSGDRLLVYGNDAQARVFGLASGERELIAQHQGQVLGGLWRPDDAWLLTFARDNLAIVWEADTGRAAFNLPHETSPPQRGAFNSDLSRLVTVQSDRFARVWDTALGALLYEFETPPALGGAAFVLEDSAILSWSNPAANRAATHLVDAATGETLWLLEGGTLSGTAAFSAAAGRLVSYGERGAEVVDVASGERLHRIEHPNINGAIISADGQTVVSFGEVGVAQVFDVALSEE